MLSKPKGGWTDLTIGKYTFALSDLTDVPISWLKQSIAGLERLHPFTVRGSLEPGRLLVTVSYHRCHIICESEGKDEVEKDDVFYDIANISMLEFCEELHGDISRYFDDWVEWPPYYTEYTEEEKDDRVNHIKSLLKKLGMKIEESREYFTPGRGFL